MTTDNLPATQDAPPDPHSLMLARNPTDVIEEAKRAAAALEKVIATKPNPVVINGAQYLEYEDWQTLGAFFGVTAKTVETKLVEFGAAKGFEAVAIATDASARELTRQESMCLNDELQWRGKPLFMLRSMAQTRANAKALRAVLSWTVVLAGFRPQDPQDSDEFDQSTQPTRPTNYIELLRQSILTFVKGDKARASDILRQVSGKTAIKDLNQAEAERAIRDFESKYLQSEARMD